MVMTGSSSLTRVSEFIAKINGEKSDTARKRLKEWYLDSDAKKGKKRKQLDISQCESTFIKMDFKLMEQ